MKGKTLHTAEFWLYKSLETFHSRMVTLGLFVGACYLPLWLTKLVVGTLHGGGAIFTAAALVLGLHRLWQQRQELAGLEVNEGDRTLGYFLIGISLLLLPLGFSTLWIQRVVWLQAFAGIALSSWGATVFGRYPIPTFLIVLGLFPEPTAVGVTLWQTFTPPQMLERLMAWSGTIGLKAMGQPAVQINPVSIALPGGAVEVNWGCSGFDMATVMAIASLVVGLAIRESIAKVTLMVVIGIALALIANIPRIMLLALSEAYWGKGAFDFWHGPWGGQIFAGTIFTIYYYVVMAIRKNRALSRSH
ncbi:cyanoexosortase C [Leptolyngbya sp. FACHB-541]|uniref:cyanoexosortase C n=1 Tax=Leptolyngbya sp. FACHB-541 TaxID=2692810 RepID=UPI0016832520|nr:cyanoexosortase C [Leptolyngbya sp. FACHB-541]MBD2001073.1 cyanoexosortase C [Leptolyngbya sp. FACHB-541]